MLQAVPPGKKVKGEMLLQQVPRYDRFRRFVVLFRNRIRNMFRMFRIRNHIQNTYKTQASGTYKN